MKYKLNESNIHLIFYKNRPVLKIEARKMQIRRLRVRFKLIFMSNDINSKNLSH